MEFVVSWWIGVCSTAFAKVQRPKPTVAKVLIKNLSSAADIQPTWSCKLEAEWNWGHEGTWFFYPISLSHNELVFVSPFAAKVQRPMATAVKVLIKNINLVSDIQLTWSCKLETEWNWGPSKVQYFLRNYFVSLWICIYQPYLRRVQRSKPTVANVLIKNFCSVWEIQLAWSCKQEAEWNWGPSKVQDFFLN